MAKRIRVDAHELADSILADARHSADFQWTLAKRLADLLEQDTELADEVGEILNGRSAYGAGLI
jgi:hypothetical protein